MANATTASPAMMANPASDRIAPKRLFAFIIMAGEAVVAVAMV